eukprot:1568161-Alexandrium_andersonii.AAC.1
MPLGGFQSLVPWEEPPQSVQESGERGKAKLVALCTAPPSEGQSMGSAGPHTAAASQPSASPQAPSAQSTPSE